MKWARPVCLLFLVACGDSTSEVELATTYVLMRAERNELPVVIERGSAQGVSFEGRVVSGSLRFIRQDSVALLLRTEYMASDSAGRPLAREEACSYQVLPFKRDGSRVLIDVDRAPDISIHDTLSITGKVISGRHRVAASSANAAKPVLLDFLAGVPGELVCF